MTKAERLKAKYKREANRTPASNNSTGVKVAQASALGSSLIMDNISSLMIGVEKANTISKQGKEASRAIESIGINSLYRSKDTIDNIAIVNENLSEMLSEVDNQARYGKAVLITAQSESNLSGASHDEARAIIDVDKNKDEGVLKRKAKQDRMALLRKSLAGQRQDKEDIKSIQSQLITEREAKAQGIIDGLKSLASQAGTITSAYGV